MEAALTANSRESIVIRRLSIFDMDAFSGHLLRLDSDSRRLRFGGPVSDSFLAEYAQHSSRWNVIIFGYFVDGTLRGAGELRPISGNAGNEAELAFSVEPDWRRLGVGRRLLSRLMRAARNRGYTSLHMSFLPANDAMQRLARSVGARIIHESGESMGIIEPGPATASSLLAEASEEASTFALATIQLSRSWLPHGLLRAGRKSALIGR